jgi:hypothetical protein
MSADATQFTPPPNRRPLKPVLIRWLLGILAVLVLIGWQLEAILPHLLDYPALQRQIQTAIQQATGIRLETRTLNIRPTLLEGIVLSMDSNVLRDPEEIKLVDIDRIRVHVRWLPLLTGEKEFSKVQFDGVKVFLDEESYFFRLKLPPPAKEPEVEFRDTEILWTNFVVFANRSIDPQNAYRLDGKRLRIQHVESDRPITVEADTLLHLVMEPTPSTPAALVKDFQTLARLQLKGVFERAPKGPSAGQAPPLMAQVTLKQLSVQMQGLALEPLSRVLNRHGVPIEADGQVFRAQVALQRERSLKHVPFRYTARLGLETADAFEIAWRELDYAVTKPVRLDVQATLHGNVLAASQWRQWTVPDFRTTLRHQDLQLKAHGYYLASNRYGLWANTNRFNLTTLKVLPPVHPSIQLLHQATGLAGGSLQLRQEPNRPLQRTGTLTLQNVALRLPPDGRIGGQTVVSGVSGQVSMKRQGQETINLAGRLFGEPFSLTSRSWQPARRPAQINGTLSVSRLPLADTLAFLRHPLIQAAVPSPMLSQLRPFAASGSAQAAVGWVGNADAPRLSGTVRLRDVSLAVAPDGRPLETLFRDADGRIVLAGRDVILSGIQALFADTMVRLNGRYGLDSETLALQVVAPGLQLAPFQQNLIALAQAFGQPVDVLQTLALSGPATARLQLTGPIDQLILAGDVDLGGVRLTYKPIDLTAEAIRGRLSVGPGGWRIPGITATVDGSPIRLSGQAAQNFSNYQLALSGQGIALAPWLDRLAKVAPQSQEALELLAGTTGTANLDLRLVATGGGAPQITGQVDLGQVVLQPAELPFPIAIDQLALNLTGSGRGVLAPSVVRLGELDATVQGTFSTQPGGGYDLRVDTGTTPVAALRTVLNQLRERPRFAALPQLWNTAGEVRLVARLTPQAAQGELSFLNAGASWEGGDFPLYQLNGTARFALNPRNQAWNLDSNRLTFRYGNSPMAVSINTASNGAIQLTAEGVASPLLLTHFIIPRDMTQTIQTVMPFSTQVAGVLKTLDPNAPLAQLTQNQVDVSLQADIPSEWTLPQRLVAEQEQGPTLASLLASLRLTGNSLVLAPSRLNLFDVGEVHLSGKVERLFSEQTPILALRLVTPETLDFSKIDFSKLLQNTGRDGNLFEGITGTMAADLTINRTGEGTGEANGFLRLENVSIPPLNLENLTGRLAINNRQGTLTLDRLAVPGADLSVQARTENILAFPVTLEDVRISGTQLNINQLSQFGENILIPKVQNILLTDVYRPPKAWEPWFPFQFRNGQVAFEELVYQNIIIEDVRGQLSVFSKGFTELRNLQFQTAGGQITGSLSINPRDNNYLSLELYPQNVKANALARALLQLPNTIFGDLSGSIRATTQGLTPEELISNANGVASMVIRNGRLPQIARVETLLTGANILRGGIVGLNLNNLMRALRPFDTNYFSELSGDFQIASGTVYTENLLSNGENLDLYISGSIRLVDGMADLTVVGAMSQDVSGALGTLGKLSIGRLVSFIPGLGTLPGARGGLLSYLPGIGFVPGFGGPARDINRFRIHVRGPLEDPSSVQDLQWL